MKKFMITEEQLRRRPPSWLRFLQVGLGVIAKKEAKTI